jgi:hypothetical protein
MPFLFLTLCALCEAFLLRFLVALVKEGRAALGERGDPWRSRQAIESSGELFPMNSESIKGKHKRKQAQKSVALM